MPCAEIKNVEIKAVSTVVAEREESAFSIPGLYGGNIKRLKKVVEATGFEKRRVAAPETTAADMCVRAAEDIFENSGIGRDSIEAVVFVSQYPDYVSPATACILQSRLGLPNSCAAFDVNQGCAGYVYGLWIASSLLSSGACRRVLMLAGDTPNKIEPPSPVDSVPMFGDAGSATVLDFNPDAASMYFDTGTDGSGWDMIACKNGMFRTPPSLSQFRPDGSYDWGASMDKLAVVDFTLKRVPASVSAVLSRAGWDAGAVDAFLMHQANKLIIESIADALGGDYSKFPADSITKYGNLSCVSIPAIICDNFWERLRNGEMSLVMSGFGIGLSWASVALRAGPIYCSKILECG